MRVDDIKEIDVKFVAMIIGQKVYQSNQLNSIFGNNNLIAHEMVKEDSHYDLYTMMLKELMTNLHKIKQDKKNTFRYGSFVIYLALYFLNTIPSFGKIHWDFDHPIATQIAKILDSQGDKKKKVNLWAFLKTFQEEMKNRARIPKSIVENIKILYILW